MKFGTFYFLVLQVTFVIAVIIDQCFYLGRHLDLDQATFENGESKERVVARELSLQMKLDYFQDVSL